MNRRNNAGLLSAGVTMIVLGIVFLPLVPVLPHSRFYDVAWPVLDLVYWVFGALLLWRYFRLRRR